VRNDERRVLGAIVRQRLPQPLEEGQVDVEHERVDVGVDGGHVVHRRQELAPPPGVEQDQDLLGNPVRAAV
jgi:hypothetical protein